MRLLLSNYKTEDIQQMKKITKQYEKGKSPLISGSYKNKTKTKAQKRAFKICRK